MAARSFALYQAALLLCVAVSSTTGASATRRLMANEETRSPRPANAPVLAVQPGTTPVQLASVLAPLAESLQANPVFLATALTCAEATGLPVAANSVPKSVVEALAAFEENEFCALPTVDEQVSRISYMVMQAFSIQYRAMFLSDFACNTAADNKPLQAMPQACQISAGAIDDAVADAVAMVYRGSTPCSQVTTDATKPIKVLSLPADWEPRGRPALTCTPRPKPSPVAVTAVPTP